MCVVCYVNLALIYFTDASGDQLSWFASYITILISILGAAGVFRMNNGLGWLKKLCNGFV